jgi:TolB-like protein
MKNTVNKGLFIKPITGLMLMFISICQAPKVKADEVSGKPSIAILDFDTRGYSLAREEALQFIINELIRVGQFEVMDRYDIEYISKRDTLQAAGCFSKICLTEFGNKLGVNKMFSGNIQHLGDKINVTVRLLDVNTGVFEKANTKEFLNISGNELTMIRITINEMFGLPNDADNVKKLTVQSDYDNTVNNPYQLKLRADGPRMGVGFFTGTSAAVLKSPESEGGYNAYPFMFQFGYQFEKQYLNEGNFQALFEFIPNISGMDQGRFIPSFTFLNGLRSNKTGWEFAFGPTMTFTKTARGFVGPDGKWYLQDQSVSFPNFTPELESRLDSRGSTNLTTGFLFGFGKTLKSGRMNIPVNGYVIPGKGGLRFGVSFGWNGKERYTLR